MPRNEVSLPSKGTLLTVKFAQPGRKGLLADEHRSKRKAWQAPKRRAANVRAWALTGPQGTSGTCAIKRKPGWMPCLQAKRTDLHEKYDDPALT